MEATDTKGGRDQSTIAFPYLSLGDAISVARALHGGGGSMDRDQLAAAMDAAPGSGSFSLKLGTARMFGLVEVVKGRNQLTDLGKGVVDPAREQAAKAEAFLRIPLYRRAYDEFRGGVLPPRPAGLEGAFVGFGVAPKQADKARQAFDRSARLAGFFPNSKEDRLVMPVLLPGGDASAETLQAPLSPVAAATASVARTSNFDLLIQGLLDRLPPAGEEWPYEKRVRWLQILAGNFDMVYTAGADNTVDQFITIKLETL